MSGPQLHELTVERAAFGGHGIARLDNRVVFVRHGIPGERVLVVFTEQSEDAKFWRADVVDVLQAHPSRVQHPWPAADALAAQRSGTVAVGGAEYAHMSLDFQRTLKAQVFQDVLSRNLRSQGLELADLGWQAEQLVAGLHQAEALLGERADGLHWRSRVSFAVSPEGALGMHPYRSSEIIELDAMPLAVTGIAEGEIYRGNYAGFSRVDVAHTSTGETAVLGYRSSKKQSRGRGARRQFSAPELLSGPASLHEVVYGFTYSLDAAGFWQIHRSAADTLATIVHEFAEVEPGQQLADLYAGAGLFSARLAPELGGNGSLVSVEGSAQASEHARANLKAAPAQVIHADVHTYLQGAHPVSITVLDPPRTGAGNAVVEHIAEKTSERVVYVSCDPSTFSRDLGFFAQRGWRLQGLRLLDMYPHTHHMESVALLTPS